MRRVSICSVAVIVAALAGCGEHDVYELRLVPRDDGLQRTLTAWREGGSAPVDNPRPNKPPPESALRRLGKLYSERLTGDADIRQTFRGVFLGKQPADVGGRGSYDVVATPLGTVYIYLERFRGSDDLDAELYDRRAAADRLCDLLVAWFDKQLADAPERGNVRRFLHQELRQDVRNLAAVALVANEHPWSPVAPEGNRRVASSIVLAGNYLVEHDYSTIVEAAALDLGDDRTRWAWVRRVLSRKSGIAPARGEELFAFIDGSDAMTDSWRELLRTTPEYAQLRKSWNARRAEGDAGAEPDPLTVLEQLTSPTFGDYLAGAFPDGLDEVRLTLALPDEPLETNGRWDEAQQTLSWTLRLRDAGGIPAACYAAWTTADETFQTRHLGRVALTGSELRRFAGLYRSLTAAQRREIDKHLESLEPGDAIKGRARDFRLVGPADEWETARATRLIEVLADAL